MKKIAVIGLGLMGGSLALALKEKSKIEVLGIDANIENAAIALDLGIVDRLIKLEDLKTDLVDLVIVATPVHTIAGIIANILDFTNDKTTVIDLGSTKGNIAESLLNHPNRKRYVAVHPIAGTEYSGPQSAFSSLFKGKVNMVCDAHLSDDKKVEMILEIFENIGMRNRKMTSEEHDKHIAYVSHLSHVSSFMLGRTVLEIEKNEKNIFDMAGSGFESTVRLAKSSPEMWTPIFLENKAHLLTALSEYITNLNDFKNLIVRNEDKALIQNMREVNYLKKVLVKK